MDTSATTRRSRLVFLDRDGVINVSPPVGSWVFRWDDFCFAPGALHALRRLHQHGFTVAVITNQSCIGRGLAPAEEIHGINARMLRAVEDAGGRIAGVYTCPHPRVADCACRKPKPGLIDQAAAELGIDPTGAYLVGDAERDIEAGLARGCTTILVAPPGAETANGTKAHHVVSGLPEAVELILALSRE